MKGKNSIVNLIKSLSKGEKRAFTLSATKYSTNKKNSLLQLYHLYDGSESGIDVDKSISQLGKTPLSVLKSKLFYQILQTLRVSSNYSKHPLSIVNEKQEFASILYHRGLFNEAASYSRQAMKLAEKYEYFERVLSTIDQQVRIYQKCLTIEQLEPTFQELQLKRQKTLVKLKNLWEYEELKQKIYAIYLSYSIPQNEKEKAEYKSYFESHLLKSMDYCQSNLSSLHYFSLKAIEYNLEGNTEKAYQITKELLVFLENEFLALSYEPDRSLSVLNNLITFSISLKKFEEALEWLERLNQYKSQIQNFSQYYEIRFFEIKYNSLLEYYFELGLYKEGLSLRNEIEKGIAAYQNVGLSRSRIIRFYFGLSIFSFFEKDFKAALSYNINVLNEQHGTSSLTIMCISKFLYLILSYEMGQVKYLENKVQSTRAFLKKHKRLGEAELIFLKHFNLLLKSNNTTTKMKVLANFKEEFLLISSSENHEFFTEYLKVNQWLATKI